MIASTSRSTSTTNLVHEMVGNSMDEHVDGYFVIDVARRRWALTSHIDVGIDVGR